MAAMLEGPRQDPRAIAIVIVIIIAAIRARVIVMIAIGVVDMIVGELGDDRAGCVVMVMAHAVVQRDV